VVCLLPLLIEQSPGINPGLFLNRWKMNKYSELKKKHDELLSLMVNYIIDGARLKKEIAELKKENDELQMALDAYDREHISW